MWFFIVKSIVGAVLGQATNVRFKKKTAMGKWFRGKMESGTTGRQKDMISKILTAEEKTMQKFLF